MYLRVRHLEYLLLPQS